VSYDPWESANRSFHAFNNTLDDNFLKPIADGYAAITPDPVQRSVTNFFDNISLLNTVLNDLLQDKPNQGASDFGRFLVNSTIGIGGLFDPATGMGLESHEEDLGQTLAVWGVGEGNYVEIPGIGPNSTRDAPDLVVSAFTSVLRFLSTTVAIPVTALDIINSRANLSSAIALRNRSALDTYIFTREAYRQRRTFLIYDGEPPDEEFEKLDQAMAADFN